MPGPSPYYYYYGYPQRTGPDGQIIAQPAPGTNSGVYPPLGSGTAINPITGNPIPVGTMGTPVASALPIQLPFSTEPPVGGTQSLDVVTTNVVQAPTGGQANAISAAATLASSYAFNLSGVTVSTLVPSSAAATVALITYQAVSPGVFRKFQIQAYSAMALRAIRVQIQLNNSNFPGLTEVELSSFYEDSEEGPIFVPFQKNDTIQVLARNVDLQSSYVVTARLTGWRYSGV